MFEIIGHLVCIECVGILYLNDTFFIVFVPNLCQNSECSVLFLINRFFTGLTGTTNQPRVPCFINPGHDKHFPKQWKTSAVAPSKEPHSLQWLLWSLHDEYVAPFCAPWWWTSWAVLRTLDPRSRAPWWCLIDSIMLLLYSLVVHLTWTVRCGLYSRSSGGMSHEQFVARLAPAGAMSRGQFVARFAPPGAIPRGQYVLLPHPLVVHFSWTVRCGPYSHSQTVRVCSSLCAPHRCALWWTVDSVRSAFAILSDGESS